MCEEEKTLLEKVFEILEGHEERCDRIADTQIHTEGYAEPGYTDPESGIVAIGNWNDVAHWDEEKNEFVTVNDAPSKVAKALEELGVKLEWEDEWISCDGCNKLVRTQPDSYGWQQSGMVVDGEYLCGACILEDAEDIIRDEFEGKNNRCVTFDIDLEDLGYVELEGNFEHGLHHGQNADPQVIAKSLEKLGVKRYVFKLDSAGQFDMTFSVWLPKEEHDKIDVAKWNESQTNGVNIAATAERALRDN